jgi:hypothetical protein
MNINQWLYSKITNSTLVNVYTTKCYPIYVPSTATTPYIYYDEIGSNRNRLMRNTVFTIVSCHNSKANIELLNDSLYSLFDTSTKYIKEMSSNLKVESVSIIQNHETGFDETNKNWTKAIDISVWYN